MKVRVSIPETLFAAAEKMAGDLNITRSQLFSDALSAYLDKYSISSITARLDAVHGVAPSSADDGLSGVQWALLVDEKW